MAVTGAAAAYAGIELGGTKILCRLMGADGARLGEARFATSTPAQALADLTAFLRGSLRGRGLSCARRRQLRADRPRSLGPRLRPAARDAQAGLGRI